MIKITKDFCWDSQAKMSSWYVYSCLCQHIPLTYHQMLKGCSILLIISPSPIPPSPSPQLDFSTAVIHCLWNTHTARHVSQRLDRHAAGHQQVSIYLSAFYARLGCLSHRNYDTLKFLLHILQVEVLMTASVFICSVIITSLLYLSDALKKNFLNEKFDFKVKGKIQSFPPAAPWECEQNWIKQSV